MKKKLTTLLCLLSMVEVAQAQWTIKESELPGSNLEQISKTSSYLVHSMPDKEWDSSNFASAEELQWFKEAKYGMFISFGLSTFKKKELSWGMAQRVLPDKVEKRGVFPREVWTSWADSLSLEKFSKEELVDIIKQSGVKYMVVIAKHHDGFHLWDTKYSDFKSTNSPYKKDFIREVVDACHIAGIKVGIYYSQRDWYHPYYAPVDPEVVDVVTTPPYFKVKDGQTLKAGKQHQKYIDYQFDVVRELCTNYGKIDMFWFDANYWDGMFTAEMWDAERLTRMIRSLQPGILINNRTGVPGDYDTPEQRIGMFQNRRPWETCMTLCGGWSYTPSPVKSAFTVFQKLQSTAIGDGNLLLSWGMKWNGEWDEAQKNSFLGVGNYLRQFGHSIYETNGGPWLPDTWGGTTFHGNKVYVHILKRPETNKIILSDLDGIRIIGSKVLTGQPIMSKQVPGGFEIDMQKMSAIDSPVIIELTASRELMLSDVQSKEKTNDLFADEKVYGKVVATKSLTSGNSLLIELSQSKRVKGVKVECGESTLGSEITLSFSKDGINWDAKKAIVLQHKISEIPITSYQAGALIEGVDASYVKIELQNTVAETLKCMIYGGM